MTELHDNSPRTPDYRPYVGPDGWEPDPQDARDIDGERGTRYDGESEEDQKFRYLGWSAKEWGWFRDEFINIIGCKGRSERKSPSGWGFDKSYDEEYYASHGLAQDGIDLEVRRAIRRVADEKGLELSLAQLETVTKDLCSAYRPSLRNGVFYYPLCSLDAARKEAAFIAVDRGERQLVVSSVTRLLEKEYRPKEALMVAGKHEIFHTPSCNQVHAWRGVGKSRWMRGFLKAVATGSQFLLWQAPRAFRVLHVEGETPAGELQRDLREQVGDCDTFFIVTAEDQEDSTIPSIATPEGRSLIERAITSNSIEVVAFDSLSTLANVATNDEENLLEILGWFKHLRTKYGIAVFFLHHDGKGGLQRGSSKIEDLLDKSIQLTWEEGYKGTEGLRCIMHFDKARQPVRVGARLKIELTTDQNGSSCWTWSELSKEKEEENDPAWVAKAREMRKQKKTYEDIASALGLAKNMVWRRLNKKKNTEVEAVEEENIPF